MGRWVCNLIRNSGERFFLQRTTLDFFKSNRNFSQSSSCAVLGGPYLCKILLSLKSTSQLIIFRFVPVLLLIMPCNLNPRTRVGSIFCR